MTHLLVHLHVILMIIFLDATLTSNDNIIVIITVIIYLNKISDKFSKKLLLI